MKKIVTVFLFSISLNLIHAAEYIPSDVQRIIDVRKNEIKKIDEQYCDALKRSKVRYTQSGDLENALLIDQLIKEVQIINADSPSTDNDKFVNTIVDEKWTWRHQHDKGSWFILRADGTGNFSNRATVKWVKIGDRKIKMTLPKGSTVLTWNDQINGYTCKDTNRNRDVSGTLSGR